MIYLALITFLNFFSTSKTIDSCDTNNLEQLFKNEIKVCQISKADSISLKCIDKPLPYQDNRSILQQSSRRIIEGQIKCFKKR